MTLSRHRVTIGVLAISAVVVAVSLFAAVQVTSQQTLAGARLLAEGRGSVDVAFLSTPSREPMKFDDVDTTFPTLLRPGSRPDDRFWLLSSGNADWFELTKNGTALRANFTRGGLLLASATIAEDGSQIVAHRNRISVSPFDGFIDADDAMSARFVPGALALRPDGQVVAGSRSDPRIQLLSPDGDRQLLLGRPGDTGARAQASEDLGPIVALALLPDQRVVFASDATQGRRLYVLDDTEARQVAPDQPDLVTAEPTEVEELPRDIGRQDHQPIDPINVTDDGRVIAIGEAPDDGHPVIRLVDVDTGQVEVLADLDGVEASLGFPVSAVGVGDDLVFLAEDKLWKLEGALAP